MALIDDIEELGAAVTVGRLTQEEAAQELADRSNGGLTLSGAKDAIDSWKTSRASYRDTFDRAEDALRKLREGNR